MKKRIIVIGLISLFLLGSSAYGQSNIGFMGIGGMIGFVSPEDPIDSTIAFGLRADLGTIITPKLAFLGEIMFWSKGYDYHFYGEGDLDASFSVFQFSALVKYALGQQDAQFKPYIGGGLGLQLGRAKIETPFGDESDSDTDIGITFLVGGDYAFSPTMDGFAEFRYTLGGADFWGIFAGVMMGLNK